MTAVSGGLYNISTAFIMGFGVVLLGFSILSSDAHQTTLAPTEKAIALLTLIVREMDITPAVNLA